MSARPLNPKARQLALAMARGQTLRAWAKAAGIAERTARNWSAHPEFKPLVIELREEIVKRAVARLAGSTVKAVTALVKLLKSENEGTRLRAAQAILTNYSSLDMYSDIRGRLAALDGNVHDQRTEAY